MAPGGPADVKTGTTVNHQHGPEAPRRFVCPNSLQDLKCNFGPTNARKIINLWAKNPGEMPKLSLKTL